MRDNFKTLMVYLISSCVILVFQAGMQYFTEGSLPSLPHGSSVIIGLLCIIATKVTHRNGF